MGISFVGVETLPAHPALEVAVEEGANRWSWSVTNVGEQPIEVQAVRLRFVLSGPAAPVRCFSNGYQSWSETGAVTLGVHQDPSRTVTGDPLLDDVVGFARRVHHADPAVAPAGEVRSECVTVLRGAERDARTHLFGFLGGSTHDGTLRMHERDDGAIDVVAEAYLGNARLDAGTRRALHDVVVDEGSEPGAMLEAWAAAVGGAEQARVEAPYQVGWCSWYHYFHAVTEDDIRSNLARAGDWPFTVFQVDDGYQSAIGDWLTTNDKFPSGVEQLAADIAGAGYTPGIWIAPFLAAPDSQVLRDHPDWAAGETVAASGPGEPLMGWFNPEWGGLMATLDTTLPAVQDHLADTAAALVAAGYQYLKLDFTCVPALEGRWADPTKTPAERVRLGYEAVRRGAGDDTFILGCGCPLGAVVGLVDGMRIGPDVAPSWDYTMEFVMPGYEEVTPATKGAWRSTLARAFLHRKMWLNDPDCIMLRTTETELSPEAARGWALAVGVSGGMALVSDDLALLGADERALLDEVLALGRASDAAAVAGAPARCGDLLDDDLPVDLHAGADGGLTLPLIPPFSRQ